MFQESVLFHGCQQGYDALSGEPGLAFSLRATRNFVLCLLLPSQSLEILNLELTRRLVLRDEVAATRSVLNIGTVQLTQSKDFVNRTCTASQLEKGLYIQQVETVGPR